MKEGLQVRGKKGLSADDGNVHLEKHKDSTGICNCQNNLYTKEMCISWNIYYFSIKILKAK